MRNVRRRPRRKVVYTGFGSSRRFVYARIGPMIEHHVYTPLLIRRCVIHLRNGACRVTRASSVGFRACNASDRTVRRVSTIVAVAVAVASYVSLDHPTGKKSCARVRLSFHHGRVRTCACVCASLCVCVFVVSSRRWSWHTCASLSVTRIQPYCVSSS